MVATGVARLAEDGRLSLDDPVVARVPEVRGAAGRPRIIYVMLWGLPRLDE
jgi:CubicO group peptidase (beta-lactamase class C family)